MKTKNLLTLILFFLTASQFCFAQNNHALIVAIGDYPDGSGWPKISSKNDVVLIDSALQKQNFHDIKIIRDKEATVAGISAALDNLIASSKPGDVDVIHFSCHGEQIEDVKKPSHKADGLEESIVTYDAKLPEQGKKYTRDYFTSLLPGYYREDMFGAYVDKLRAKLGKNGDLIVFLDFCHAGIGTRGSVKVRGGKGALVSPGFSVKSTPAADLAKSFSNDDDGKADDSNLATYVVFGAARANELDYETVDLTTGKEYGSLSYAVSRVLSNLLNLQNTNITYQSLFAQIQSVMNENATNQHPVLAGNGMDRSLFGGKFVTQKPYIEVDQVKEDHVTIRGGSIMGLDSGAKVALYPSGTTDPKNAKLIDNGTVIKSALFTAEVKFSKPVNLKQPADGWVFVTSPVFKNDPLKVGFGTNKTRGPNAVLTFSEPERIKLIAGIKTIPGVLIAEKPEIEMRKGNQMDSIIIAQTGLLFDTIKSASADIAWLKTKINRYMQYTYLKNIVLKDPDAMVDIKLIPVVKGKVDSAKMKSLDKTYAFKDGDEFRLLVTNNGTQAVYVNILDLQPDGKINKIIPYKQKNISPEELSFPAGSSRLFKNKITIGPPYGKETFKIFVSTDPIDVEGIADSRGTASRGNLKLFESLVKNSYGTGTRGVMIGLGDADGSAYNLVFDIVPNK